MTTLYFKTDANGFNVANQAPSAGTRKLLASGGTGGIITATESTNVFGHGIFAASDGVVGGSNGAFTLAMSLKNASIGPRRVRPILYRYNSAGLLQMVWTPVVTGATSVYGGTSPEDRALAGNQAVFALQTWSLTGIDLGTWTDGDIVVAGCLYTTDLGSGRSTTNLQCDTDNSSLTVPW